MLGKPYRSKLRSYHDEIFALLDGGMNYRQVAQALNRKYVAPKSALKKARKKGPTQ